MLNLLGSQSGQLVYAAYLLAFSLSALVCLGAACRARLVPDTDTRWALVGFFLGSGAWAGAYVGFLLVDSALGRHLFYQLSLIVGFGTVWAWLWFCSAYSGRALHRNGAVQWFAIAVFAAVTVLKGTNPWHGLYYGLEPSGGPLGLVVHHEMLYWVVMVLAYALATAGYLMIYELFIKAEARVLPLAVLTGLTALPAVLNVIGHAHASVMDVTHEPLGAAAFAVGLLVVYKTQFSIVHLSGSIEDPNLTVGSDGRIWGIGGGAVEMIPSLSRGEIGRPLEEVLPELAEVLRDDRSVWQVDAESGGRYYRAVQTSSDGTGDLQMIVLSDITERKRREQRLAQRNDLFEKAQDLADVGAWEYDVLEDILTWTRQVYVIHGLPEDARLTPQKAIEHYHREDRPQIKEVFTRAVEEGIPYDEELRIRRPDGEVRWVRSYGEPQMEEGAIVRVRGAFKDITERKRRERRANRLRRMYQTTLEGAPDAIFLADRETGRIEQANQKAAELIGVPPEEIVGRSQMELHPDGESSRYRQLFEDVARRSLQGGTSETVQRFEDGSPTYIQTDAGERVPVEISATTIELESRQLTLGIFRDVTKQRQREQALRRAKEEADQANQMKSAFLANMSHEIRTPLTSIIGFAEAIGTEAAELELPDGTPLPDHADLIEQSGKRLLETLEGVMTLSKLEAGQMELASRPVDLARQARCAAEELGPDARKKGIDLYRQLENLHARADEAGIQMVTRNLLSNAIKYTEAGGTVRVRTYREDDRAVLEVEDTGIGMEPSVADGLFDPFRQASEGFAREYEGTGVGLAVTREATEQMGGTIEVETQKGQGSRFTARFPEAKKVAPVTSGA